MKRYLEWKRYTLCKLCVCALAALSLTAWRQPPPASPGIETPGGVIAEDAEYITASGVVGDVRKKENGKGQKQILLSLKSVVFCNGNPTQKTEWKKADGMLCYLREAQTQPLPGDHVIVTGKARYFERQRNPGGFDEAAYYRGRGVLLALKDAELMRRYAGGGCRRALYRLREAMARVLEDVCGRDGGVMRAMLLGDKTYLEPDTKKLYQDGGIFHILAISGLHISFLGMGLYRLLKRLYLPIPAAGVVSGALLLSYVAMSGASPSACRAGGMFAISLLAESLGRSYDRLTALSFSALLYAAFHPDSLFQSGFLLSYGAILGLELVYPALAALWEGRLAKPFLGGVSVTVITLPILLTSFYSFPVYSFFLNLFVIPLMSAVMAFGLLALLAGFFFAPLGRLLFFPAHCILLIFETACRISLRLPGSRWIMGKPSALQLGLYAALILLLLLMGRCRTKLCVVLLLCCGLWTLHTPFFHTDTVTVLDVGQGDGIVLRGAGGADGCAVMIDGGSSSETRLGENTLLPYLRSQKITALSYVFLTHMDADHISGIEELIETKGTEGVRIRTLVLPRLPQTDEEYMRIVKKAREAGVRVCTMQAGEGLSACGFTFTCLHPDGRSMPQDRNDASLVLYVRNDAFTALFMGDLDGEAEREFLRNELPPGRVGLLKVGHHGSRESSCAALLERLRPQTAVISCGENNRYGHPAAETLERLRAAGCSVLTTPEYGAVIIEAEERGRAYGWKQSKGSESQIPSSKQLESRSDYVIE